MTQVSVLMLDIVDSTPLSQRLGGEAYRSVFLPEFDRIVTAELAAHGGREFQRQEHRGDDCVKAVFDTPHRAVAFAVDLQNRFKQFSIPVNGQDIPISFRVAVHTCPAMSDGIPDTSEIPVVARVMALSKGGQVLLSQACHDAYTQHASAAFSCLKYGPYDLKGIAGLQHVYDLCYDGTQRGEPGTGLIDYAAVEAANQYIERVEVEASVRGKFTQRVGRSGSCRFVTIYGEGGMGKTRLAVNCAKQMAGDFPGGIAWVTLAFVTNPTPEIVADAILSGLHLKAEPGDLQAQVLGNLKTRSATLLLLDNAETIATCESVITYLQDLLGAVPQVRFLVTSRRPIGLHTQEAIVDVNAGLTAREALQLFKVRANDAFALPDVSDADLPRLQTALAAAEYQLPQGTFTEREQDTLRLLRLFHLANRNTLALELIASWTHKYQTLRDLLNNYEAKAFNRLTRLSYGIPSGDAKTRERQRSLEDSYHWSWRNLGEEANGQDAQSAFLAAALFATTFDEDSIAAVLSWEDEDRVADALAAVQNAALIRPDATSGTTRYRMHWQLQEYGREEMFRVSPEMGTALPTQTTLRERFIAYYDEVTMARGGDQVLRSSESRACLNDEWRNVLTAASYAEVLGDLYVAGLLHHRLAEYFRLTGKWQVWEQSAHKSYDMALRISRATGQRCHEAAALNNLGYVYELQDKWSKAEQACKESLNIHRELGTRQRVGWVLGNLGNIYKAQGKLKEAEHVHGKSLRIFCSLGDLHGGSKALNNLGNTYWLQGNLGGAEQVYEVSLRIFRVLGDRQGQGWILGNLGIVYGLQGKWSQAEKTLQKAQRILYDLEDLPGTGKTLRNLVLLYLKQGKRNEACEFAHHGLEVAKQTQNTTLVQWFEEIVSTCNPSN